MRFSISLSILVQGYVTLLGIALMPLYLHYLGPESFGLVGFFLMAQAWIQILDMGLTPALSREMSRLRAGSISLSEAAQRLHSLEWILGIISLIIVTIIWLATDLIASGWIRANELSTEIVALCLLLIGGAIILRWLAGLYRGVLIGLEQQHRVTALMAIFATFRFGGAIPLLICVSAEPEIFFSFQLVVSTAELLVYGWHSHRHIPIVITAIPDLSSLKSMLPLVGSMAFLNAMWIMLTQIDKLVLSGILNLQDYGRFTLAVVAAGGVLILTPSMNQIVQPRLSYLFARGELPAFNTLYSLASQLGVIGFVGLGAGLAFFAETIMQIWTRDAEVARTSAPILFWYGLANAQVGIMLMPFMLQFAKGQLRLHVIGNLILLLTLIPVLVIAAWYEGALGTGQALFAANFLFLLAWSPLIHKRFMPDLTWRWLTIDTLPVAAVVACILWLAAIQMPDGLDLPHTLIWIGGAMFLATIVGFITGGHTRRFAIQTLLAAGQK